MTMLTDVPSDHASSCSPTKPMSRLTPTYYATRHSLPSERSNDTLTETDELRRYSAPTMASSSIWPAVVVPESILMTTEVHIAGVAQRGDHCVYLLEIESSSFGAHVLNKRYSEIRELRGALLALQKETQQHKQKHHCGRGPCAQLARLAQIKFPRRRLQLPGLAGKREANFDVAQQRVPQLERFLQAVLRVYRMATRREMRACKNSKCGALELVRGFFDVSEPVLSELEQSDAVASYCDLSSDPERSVDYKMPLGLAPVHGPKSYPVSLRRSMYSAPLYSIEEQPETAAAH